MDFSFWSLRAFKDAFERRDGEPAPPDAALRVACLWLVYAADRLWANITHGRVFGRRPGSDGPGTVMTREMWDAWQRGLLASRETCVNEDTRKLISDALECTRQASR